MRARSGPGIFLLALLSFLLDLFALGASALGAATPAAVLVLLSAVAALFFLLLALDLILLATRSAAGARSRSADKIRKQNLVFDSMLCQTFVGLFPLCLLPQPIRLNVLLYNVHHKRHTNAKKRTRCIRGSLNTRCESCI